MDVVPTVDYRFTSRRPGWTALPADVRSEVGRLAGREVRRAEPVVTSGFTGSYAGIVHCVDGARVFVKAGGPESPHVQEALEQEARVLAGLPPGIPAPALVGSAAVGEWRVLVLAVVDGHLPGQPWTPAEVEAVRAACTAIARLATPAPAGLAPRSVAEDIAGDERVVAVGAALAAGRFDVPGGMPPWPLSRQREVGTLVLAAGGRLGGRDAHARRPAARQHPRRRRRNGVGARLELGRARPGVDGPGRAVADDVVARDRHRLARPGLRADPGRGP